MKALDRGGEKAIRVTFTYLPTYYLPTWLWIFVSSRRFLELHFALVLHPLISRFLAHFLFPFLALYLPDRSAPKPSGHLLRFLTGSCLLATTDKTTTPLGDRF